MSLILKGMITLVLAWCSLMTAPSLAVENNTNVVVNEQLLNAALTGDLTAIEKALAQGASLEARDARLDLTPLMLAIYRDHPNAIRLLVQKKAGINARNPRGQTPLMMLASGGQSELVRFLLEAEADIDLADELGNTALMWAAYWGHQPVIHILLTHTKNEAVLNMKNEDGNTALHLAASGGLAHQTRRLLQKPEHTANGRRLPVVFNGSGHLQLMKALAAAGASLDDVNHQGQTPLLLIAEKGLWEPVQWLLDSGADSTVTDTSQQGLMDYAKRSKNLAFVNRLKAYLKNIQRL